VAERQFVWGLMALDNLILRDRGSERFYSLQDIFSCTAIADITGTIQERYGYNAFGLSRVMDASFNLFSASSYDWETRYDNYRFDAESSFYQVRNRYFHPILGRWLTRDLIEQQLNEFNLYLYVKNNPENDVDFLGLYGEKSALAIVKQQYKIWETEWGWHFAAALLKHFYTKQGPATYYGTKYDDDLIKNSSQYKNAIEASLSKKSSELCSKGKSGSQQVSGDFGARYYPWTGELFWALFGAHFSYTGCITLNCPGWTAKVDVTQTDYYSFPAGFLHYRTLFPVYLAAYELQQNYGYQPFDDVEKWSDNLSS
jgi:RHS repeat-associated protein